MEPRRERLTPFAREPALTILLEDVVDFHRDPSTAPVLPVPVGLHDAVE